MSESSRQQRKQDEEGEQVQIARRRLRLKKPLQATIAQPQPKKHTLQSKKNSGKTSNITRQIESTMDSPNPMILSHAGRNTLIRKEIHRIQVPMMMRYPLFHPLPSNPSIYTNLPKDKFIENINIIQTHAKSFSSYSKSAKKFEKKLKIKFGQKKAGEISSRCVKLVTEYEKNPKKMHLTKFMKTLRGELEKLNMLWISNRSQYQPRYRNSYLKSKTISRIIDFAINGIITNRLIKTHHERLKEQVHGWQIKKLGRNYNPSAERGDVGTRETGNSANTLKDKLLQLIYGKVNKKYNFAKETIYKKNTVLSIRIQTTQD